jgi:hypothetical protein
MCENSHTSHLCERAPPFFQRQTGLYQRRERSFVQKLVACAVRREREEEEAARRANQFVLSESTSGKVKLLRQKNSASVFRNDVIICSRPAPRRGAYASSRMLTRDAMDAFARETKREGACGEGVWS